MRFLLKNIVMVFPILGLLFGVSNKMYGQVAIVNDPAHMFENGVNFGTEIGNTLKTMGFTEENLAIVKDISDYTQKAQKLMNDVNTFKAMGASLNNMYGMTAYYAKRIEQMHKDGQIDPYVYTRMTRQIFYSVNSVKKMYEQALKILSDRGLEFAQKIQMSRELTKQIEKQTEKNISDLENELALENNKIAFDEIDGILSGKLPTTVNVEAIVKNNLSATERYDAENVDESFDGGFDTPVKTTISKGLKVVLMLLGILMAVSLVFIMVRYMKGGPDSEAGFARIFVVLVVAVTLMAVLSKVFVFRIG